MKNSRQLARTWPYPRHNQFMKHLKIAAKDWFETHECKVHPTYAYCLAEWNDWHRNIILPEVVEYIEDIRNKRASNNQGFPLHGYIHHGLSSQALLFNLIGPLIVRGDLEPLRNAVYSSGLTWPGSSKQAFLEYEDRSVFNEDSGQPTSIDLVIGNPEISGSLFIECKFVETEFSGCSVFNRGDCDGENPSSDFSRCYLHYIGRCYWTLLEKYGFLGSSLFTESICVLASHYQFFREVLFALEKGGTFILLSDDRSPTFVCGGPRDKRGLMVLLLKFVPERLRDRIGQISIQEVVKFIESSGRNKWTKEFKLKYGMSDSF